MIMTNNTKKGKPRSKPKLNDCRFFQKGHILFFVFLFFSTSSFAQSEIQGRVTNQNNIPLAGVSVMIQGKQASTSTDQEGNFKITADSADVLVFRYMGMTAQEVPIHNQTSFDIVLEESDENIDEVVVVGYGTQSKSTLTTSIAKLDTKVLESSPYANAASSLQGALSGVQVQSTSGQPGASPRIIVRGGTSIDNPNGAAPLYIIDGINRENMNDLNPEDIESLQVLKDAASTAIYGARASNGVVIITTKTGKAGAVKINYSYDGIISNAGKLYELANAEEYIYFNRIGTKDIADIMNPGAINRLNLPIGYGVGNDLTNNTAYSTQYLTEENKYKLDEGWKRMQDPIDPSKTIIFEDNDWQDYIYRTGQSHDHYISVNGGGEKAVFNAGLGYMTNQGTVITTKYDRLTFNANGEVTLRDNLKVNARTMYTRSTNNEVYGMAHIFYRSAGLPPTAKYQFEDGTLAPGQSRSIGNPVYFLNNDVRDNSIENLTMSLGGEWTIVDGLKFVPQISLYREAKDGYSFIPSYWNGPTTLNSSRVATSMYKKKMQWQADGFFNYLKNIGDAHQIDATAGFSYFARQISDLNATGQGAATDLIPTLNASATLVSMSSSISDLILLGYFARLNYSFNNKYLLTLNGRYDGASNLGNDYRWGFFPGISLGWNLHEEEFLMDLADQGYAVKLRGSYGVNGNISGLSDFQSQGEYSVGDRYGGGSAIQNTVIPNSMLKWEQSKTLNVGLDLGFLNNRVTFTADIYRRITDNLITSLSLPASTGFTSVYTNFGSLENKGIEFELGASILPETSALQWSVSLNSSFRKNKILSLPENGIENNRVGGVYVWNPVLGTYAWMGGLQEGGTIGDFYGYNKLGIYGTDEDAMNGPENTLTPAVQHLRRGGDVIWQDTDEDGKITSMDQIYIGNPYPTSNGGIMTNLSYRGLALQVRMDYTRGHYIQNYAKIFMDGNWQGDGNLTKDMVENSWKEQGDNATMQRFTWQQNGWNNPANSTESVERGDFLALREIALSYTLPDYILEKIKVDNVKINLSGTNLFYFTKYKGLNPEEGGQDNGRYPIPRNFSLGMSISL